MIRGKPCKLSEPLVNPTTDPVSAAKEHQQDADARTAQNRPRRDVSGSSSLATGLNMLNELEGAGILGLPYAIKLSGWPSFICLVVVGVMAGFTGYLLAMCMYAQGTRMRVRTSYPAVGLSAMGIVGQNIVRCVQLTNLLAVGVVYLVLIGSSMEIIAPLGIKLSWLSMTDRRIWTAIATVVVLPTVHLGGFKNVAILSALSLLCLTTVLGLGFYVSAIQIATSNTNISSFISSIDEAASIATSSTVHWPSWNDISLAKIPATISIFLFAFSAHGIFPDLEASMKDPGDFPSVIASVFATNIILKTAFAFTCYLAYGQMTAEVVSANFTPWCSMVVSVLIVANTCLSYPLPLIPVFRAFRIASIEPRDNVNQLTGAIVRPPSGAVRALARSGIVLGAGLIAIAIPNFTLVMGLMGSVTLSCLTFIFPAIFYLRIHGKKAGFFMKVSCYTVAFVGVVTLVGGLYSNILLVVSQDTNATIFNTTTMAAKSF